MQDPMLGRVVAQRYRLIARLSVGGRAEVFLARHVLIDRLCAIKVLEASLAADGAVRERFLQEARTANRVNHPNLVEIGDFGEDDGLVFLVMEYVPGESLRRHLERGPLGWKRAAGIGLQVASALGRAHQMGVVHLDLRPENVLLVLRRDGRDLVKLTDFGVAKLAVDAAPTPSARAELRADLRALGGVLFEATYGIEAPSAWPIAPPEREGTAEGFEVPRFFREVLATLLALDPEDRPRDGFEAHDLLRRALLADCPDAAVGGEEEASPGGRPPARHGEDGAIERAAWRERLGRLPVSQIASSCASALERVEASAVATSPDDATTAQVVLEARECVRSVESIARVALAAHDAIEATQREGRRIRSELGRKLDDVARERSKALGWAGTLSERTYQVQVRRTSGEHPLTAMEAMVWEQAALEQEEERAREHADSLLERMGAVKAELLLQSERLERDERMALARLEGRVGALHAMALEAWEALAEASRRVGVPLEELWDASAH